MIVSLSSSGLQTLLKMCTDYCDLHDIKFNAKKSVCLFFRSSVNKSCALPKIFICDTICEFSNDVKYLGVMISSSMKTTIDVKRQTRTFYAQANLLLRNFRHCTDKVKCYLFQSNVGKKGTGKNGTGKLGTEQRAQEQRAHVKN